MELSKCRWFSVCCDVTLHKEDTIVIMEVEEGKQRCDSRAKHECISHTTPKESDSSSIQEDACGCHDGCPCLLVEMTQRTKASAPYSSIHHLVLDMVHNNNFIP